MMNSLRCDVVVIGGGPAGCTAAAELAAGGRDVVLLERATVPRHKCCANGLTQHALAQLPGGVRDVLKREVRRMVITSLKGSSLTWDCPEPFMYTAPRAEVDEFLWKHALTRGATGIDGAEVTALEQTGGRVIVKTADLEVQARDAIAADGANGRVSHMLGTESPEHMAMGVALDVRGERIRPAFDAEASKLILGLGAGTYGWVFPQGDGCSIGIEAHWGLRDALQKLGTLLEFEGYTWDNVIRRCAHPIPSLPGAGGLGTGNVLVTGDAAALAQPLTGEGVRYAALSGRLAAQAILSDNGSALQLYKRSVEAQMLPDLRTGLALLKVAKGKERFAIPAARHNTRLYDVFQGLLTGGTTFSRVTEELGGLARIAAFLAKGR